MAQELHFSLGADIANTMRQVAREHLFYSYDIDKALRIYTEGIGATEEQAKFFILGVTKLQLAEDGVHLEYCEPTPEDVFRIDEWCEDRIERFTKDELYIRKGLEQLSRTGLSHESRHIGIDLSKEFLRTLNPNDLTDEIRRAVYENNVVLAVHDLFASTDQFLTNFAKLYRVMKYVGICRSWGAAQKVGYIKQLYDQVLRQDEDLFEQENIVLKNNIDQYFASIKELDRIKVIEPSKISVKYDASWISPEGDYYGLNGTTANLLHIELADKLEEVIPHESLEDGDTFYVWLEKNGWAKIHHDGVLFDNHGGKLSLTTAQKRTIKQYGQLHYNGALRFGYHCEPMSVARFKSMDDLMNRKLFDI